MEPLETALVILVSIWSLIFIMIAIAMIFLLREVKRALDKVNHILETTEEVAEGVGVPLKMAATGVAKFFNRKRNSTSSTVKRLSAGNKKK